MSESRGLESITARRACQGSDMALRRKTDVVEVVALRHSERSAHPSR